MGLIFVFIGCVFLCNPSYNLLDVLPDFIGIVLIMYGMSKTADVNAHVRSAYEKMRGALWVALAKAACFVLAVTGIFDGTLSLTAAFAAGVLECVFLLPAFSEFFDGVAYLSSDGASGGSISTDNVKIFTVVFFISRAAGACLPDIVSMFLDSSGGDVRGGSLSPENISGVLNIAFLFEVLVLGIVWLSFVGKTVMALHKNKELNDFLIKKRESEVLENKKIMFSRRTKRFFALFSVAFVPMITLRVESVFFMPEFLFGALALFALSLAGNLGEGKRLKIRLSAFVAAGAVYYAANLVYSIKFGDLYEPYNDEGFLFAYVFVTAASVVCFALFALCGRGMAGALRGIVAASAELGNAASGERREYVYKKIKKIEMFIFIYAAASVASTALAPLAPAVWLSRFILGALMFAYVLYVSHIISEETENIL